MRIIVSIVCIMTIISAADQTPDDILKQNIEKLVQAGKQKTFKSTVTSPRIEAQMYKNFEQLAQKNPEKFKQLLDYINNQQQEGSPNVPNKNSSLSQKEKI